MLGRPGLLNQEPSRPPSVGILEEEEDEEKAGGLGEDFICARCVPDHPRDANPVQHCRLELPSSPGE